MPFQAPNPETPQHLSAQETNSTPELFQNDIPAEPIVNPVKMLFTLAGVPEPARSEIMKERHDRALEGGLAAHRMVHEAQELDQTKQELVITKAELVLTQAQKEEAERLASTDYLTGMHNRRAFIEQLVVSVAEVQGEEDPRLDILFLDLDDFKHLNDTRGHLEGDKFLVQIADKFQRIFHLRGNDIMARLGGDEFAALIHAKRFENHRREDRTEDEAIAGVIKRIEDSVNEVAASMNCSVGVSTQAVRYIPGESAEAFLDRADKAMYAVKEARKGAKEKPEA